MRAAHRVIGSLSHRVIETAGERSEQALAGPLAARLLRWRPALAGPLAALALVSIGVDAQQYPTVPGPAQPAPPPANARVAQPIDLTGYWVSLVTDDWRWRMVTPPKGDVLYLPLNADGRKAAASWDPAKDEAAGEPCKAYGAAGVMRLPGRLHITWDNDTTLKVETDAGTQTRLFRFVAPRPGRELTAPATGEPTWQGSSVAQWEFAGGAGGRRRMGGSGAGGPTGPRPGSSLKVVTTRMRPGYFRKNGVPYSGNAVLTEYFTRITEPNNDEYLVVTTFLEDPQYLNGPYVRSVQFRRQADATGWNPTPCTAR